MVAADPNNSNSRPELRADEVTFVLCIEAGFLAQQALLLCESLRRFGGRLADAPVVAVCPRPERTLGAEDQAALAALGARYLVEPLNRTRNTYGTINRIVAGAWAEEHTTTPYLVVLDTDTLVVGELELRRAAMGARPVDVKGTASTGPGDPADEYWKQVAEIGGIEIERLGWLTTSCDRVRIRSSYNGGFVVVRRDLGVLRRTEQIFRAMLARNLRPTPGSAVHIRASSGWIDAEAREWWGSSQAALAVAAWSLTDDVWLYPSGYNVPVHLLDQPDGDAGEPASAPRLLHYHYLLEPPLRRDLLDRVERLGSPAQVVAWLGAYFESQLRHSSVPT